VSIARSAAPAARLTRGRNLPRALAGLFFLAGLAACSKDPEPSPQSDQVLNLYSWAEYFPSQVIRQFEAETGIQVNYSVFDSNDVAETTLSAGHSGFDLMTVNASPHLGRQIPKGLWHVLDRSKLRNLGNLDAKLLQMMEQVDPGNRYAIPYMWGTTGLIYNPEKIYAIMPGAPVQSLDMVFRPELVSRFAKCGVSVLDSWVDMLPIVSRYLHQPDLSTQPAELAAVARTFARVRPSIRRITTSGYYDQLARGELCLAIGYSADAMVARRRADELGSSVHIEFSQPLEAVPLYIDAYAIPADARNVDAALRFIDFTLRPEIGVELAQATGFAISNATAIARLDAPLRENAIVYPPEEVRRRFTLERGFSMDETRALSRAWLHEKTGN
jgi:putrescine transport system substrate-binding protein